MCTIKNAVVYQHWYIHHCKCNCKSILMTDDYPSHWWEGLAQLYCFNNLMKAMVCVINPLHIHVCFDYFVSFDEGPCVIIPHCFLTVSMKTTSTVIYPVF